MLPGSSGRRGLTNQLSRLVASAAEKGRSSVPTIVRGRNVDGSLEVVPVTGECHERAEGPEGIGDVLTRPSGPLRFGSAGLTLRRRENDVSTLWIERQVPRVLYRGDTALVRLFGRGLSPSTKVEYLLADGTLNPGLRIISVAKLEPIDGADVLELTIEVDLYADDTGGNLLPIGYDRRSNAPASPGLSTTKLRRPALYAVWTPCGGDLPNFPDELEVPCPPEPQFPPPTFFGPSGMPEQE